MLLENCRVRCRVFMLLHRDNWNDVSAEMGLLRLFVFPIARPVKAGTPQFSPPCASERPLFDRCSKNSFGNIGWAQGPRRSGKCHRTAALYSRQLVRGARALDLGPSLAVDALRHFPDTPIPHRYHSLLCGPDYHERQEWPILQSELFIRPSV